MANVKAVEVKLFGPPVCVIPLSPSFCMYATPEQLNLVTVKLVVQNCYLLQVRIGEGVRVNPYALITPETSLKNGEELKPLAKASAPLSKLEDGLGLQSAFRNIIDSPEFSVAQTTLLQVQF